jgi:beta-lactam-binding protein with PASTA domain
VGLDLDDAVAKLDQLGLSYRFEYRQSDEPEGTVIQSSPPEGLVVPIQTTVTLVVSTGRERSPTPSPAPTASAAPNPN